MEERLIRDILKFIEENLLVKVENKGYCSPNYVKNLVIECFENIFQTNT